ncbi:MAG: DUF4252 domain-containing protein [Bacteroidota bacterium]
MNRTVITLVLMAFASVGFAQNDAISKFFSKYEDDENFTQVTITARMFSLFADLDVEDQEDQELVDAISKVKGLRILAKDEIEKEEAVKLYKEAFKLIPEDEYDELMMVKDKDANMKFLIQEEGKIITELLMIMHSNNSFFLLTLVGDIDLKQISKMSKTMDIDGFEHLENIEKEEVDKGEKH